MKKYTAFGEERKGHLQPQQPTGFTGYSVELKHSIIPVFEIIYPRRGLSLVDDQFLLACEIQSQTNLPSEGSLGEGGRGILATVGARTWFQWRVFPCFVPVHPLRCEADTPSDLIKVGSSRPFVNFPRQWRYKDKDEKQISLDD